MRRRTTQDPALPIEVHIVLEDPLSFIREGLPIFIGALFFALVMITFNGFSQLSLSILKRPVFYKQRDLLFFHAWAYSLPTRYLKMSSDLFRFISSLGRYINVAKTFGSFGLLTIFFLGGFILARGWWIWCYWFSPMMYGQNCLAVNEFLGDSWKKITLNSSDTVGMTSLKSRGIFTETYWYWIAIAASIGYIIHIITLWILLYAERKNEVRMSSRVGSITESDHNKKRGMVLPFVPLSIVFDNIIYAVDMPPEMQAQGQAQDQLELLKGVSGAFRPGILTALMGYSLDCGG
ncbi:pleiotropic drug resistance protein 1 [Tanacetum coccineum]